MNFCVASAKRRESGRGVLCGGSPARARWCAVTASGICRINCFRTPTQSNGVQCDTKIGGAGNINPAGLDGGRGKELWTYDGSILVHFREEVTERYVFAGGITRRGIRRLSNWAGRLLV